MVLLPHFFDPTLLTLVRDSELDIWNSCGRSNNNLPKNTWFSRPFEPPVEYRAKKDSMRTLNHMADEWRVKYANRGGAVDLLPEYFFDNETFYAQLTGTKAQNYKMDTDFTAWRCEQGNKGLREVTVIDVLILGGYLKDEPDEADSVRYSVQEAASVLAVRALHSGAVTRPEKLVQELLFLNEDGNIPGIHLWFREKEIPTRTVRQEVKEFKNITSCFRRGKETLLTHIIKDSDTNDCLIVQDGEYRSMFMKLCDINHAISLLNGAMIVNNRRERALDLERTKREILHFFQSVNGTERRIKHNYASARMMS
jgi:hypothetical protein